MLLVNSSMFVNVVNKSEGFRKFSVCSMCLVFFGLISGMLKSCW